MMCEPEFENSDAKNLYELLNKINQSQFKNFYIIFVRYGLTYNFFISKQNLFNLWCELNRLCHESDEGFPERYDDFTEMRCFWQEHPYYFIDRLPLSVVASLFVEYIDNRVDILVNIVKTLSESDVYTACAYADKALGLDGAIETIVL